MSGTKNSGRKGYLNERLARAVISKSWEIISDVLNKQGYTKERKEAVALEVVKRTSPKEIKLDNDDIKPVLVKIIGKE